VRVKGVPSGGVSGAGALADGAGADDVGSVIDFLSGAGFVRVAFLSQARRALGLTSKSTRRWLFQLELRVRSWPAKGSSGEVRRLTALGMSQNRWPSTNPGARFEVPDSAAGERWAGCRLKGRCFNSQLGRRSPHRSRSVEDAPTTPTCGWCAVRLVPAPRLPDLRLARLPWPARAQ
jgi:hypothetical protein